MIRHDQVGFIQKLYRLISQKPNNSIKKLAQDLNRHFSKEGIQMDDKHMKRFSISLIVRETQSKTTIRYYLTPIRISSVQFSRSVMSDSLWTNESQHARSHCPSQTPSLLEHMSIESVMPSSYLILCRPLLLMPPISPRFRVFSNEVAEVLEFQL